MSPVKVITTVKSEDIYHHSNPQVQIDCEMDLVLKGMVIISPYESLDLFILFTVQIRFCSECNFLFLWQLLPPLTVYKMLDWGEIAER